MVDKARLPWKATPMTILSENERGNEHCKRSQTKEGEHGRGDRGFLLLPMLMAIANIVWERKGAGHGTISSDQRRRRLYRRL